MSPQSPQPATTATTTVHYILATSIFSILFILFLSTTPSSSPQPTADPFLFPNHQTLRRNHRLLFLNHRRTSESSPPSPPSVAYFISGSKGDSGRVLRLLFATYHPRNQYLLHLDLGASESDREELATFVQSVRVFKAAQNVNVIGKADFSYKGGSSAVSCVLHGASVLLRLSGGWDWFINLSATDYPLVTQDDLLHILSYLPKDLNFVNHTSYIGWRESRRLKPIIVDPGLYLAEMNAMFYASQKRDLPDAYQLFTGSVAGIFSRKLIEFCIFGSDNFPRTLLMYLANSPSAQAVYFPTLICNSKQFRRTLINHNLQYSSFNDRQEPRPLNSSDLDYLINIGAAFASPFLPDDPVLDKIDQQILGRDPGKPAPGGWCLGEPGNDTCSEWGDAEVLRPGPGARTLEKSIVQLLSNDTYKSNQCVVE